MRIAPIVATVLLASAAFAEPKEPKLETQKLAGSLYLLTGPGGNVVVLVGKDGAVLVDDELAPVTPQLKQAVAKLTPKPVRFVLNTHWHGDHTGGNPVLGGEGAVIVAHDNVRKRLSTEQFIELFKRTVPPTPEPGLPVITFADSLAVHLDGEDIDVVHVEPAHTDGDSLVWFKKANVIHMGDTYVTGFPFVDLSSGGNIEGFIRAADRAMALGNAATRFVPGHGVVADRAQLTAFRDMLVTIRDRVHKLMAAGKSLAEIQAARPTAEFDARWGTEFINGKQLVETIYRSPPIARAR